MTPCLTHIEEYVKNLYIRIGISQPDQLDFHKISEALGIRVFYWPDTSQALFTGGKGFILLNEQLSPQQQWQDYCHELAHVLLHVGSQSKMAASFRAYQEEKANQFMLHATVPSFMLQNLNLKDCVNPCYMIQQTFNVPENIAQLRLEQYYNRLKALEWTEHLTQYAQHG